MLVPGIFCCWFFFFFLIRCSQTRRAEEVCFALNLCSLTVSKYEFPKAQNRNSGLTWPFYFQMGFSVVKNRLSLSALTPLVFIRLLFERRLLWLPSTKKMMYWFKWPWKVFSEVMLLSWERTNEERPSPLLWHFSDWQYWLTY